MVFFFFNLRYNRPIVFGWGCAAKLTGRVRETGSGSGGGGGNISSHTHTRMMAQTHTHTRRDDTHDRAKREITVQSHTTAQVHALKRHLLTETSVACRLEDKTDRQKSEIEIRASEID